MGKWYISENESVYHTSPSCTHIELSIHKEFAEDLDGQRNAYEKNPQL